MATLLIRCTDYGIYEMRVANTDVTATIGNLKEMQQLTAAMKSGWSDVISCWNEITVTPIVADNGLIVANGIPPLPAEAFFETTSEIELNGQQVFSIASDRSLVEVLSWAGEALERALIAVL